MQTKGRALVTNGAVDEPGVVLRFHATPAGRDLKILGCHVMKGVCSRRGAGFTLIELMITVAVIGILAAIAYPSFMALLIRSDRSEARSALMAVQLAQERYRMNNSAYAGSVSTLGLPLTDGKYASEKGLYHIDVVAGSQSSGGYALEALAQGKQTRDVEECRKIELTVSQGGEERTPAACW